MKDALMQFDPATGESRPYPSHANVIRTVAPHLCAERDELAEKIAEAINGRSVK